MTAEPHPTQNGRKGVEEQTGRIKGKENEEGNEAVVAARVADGGREIKAMAGERSGQSSKHIVDGGRLFAGGRGGK